jgi:hypothetical protein
LAARRAAVYPPDDLLARESDLVGLLADRRPVEPDRHRSFEAAMRWNISRMPASASDFLAHFARLDSPFSADVVEDRWSAPGIEALEVLLDFGLVERSSAGFRVPRPVQAFARQKDLN